MIKLNGKEIKFDTFPNGETKLNEDDIRRFINVISLNQKISFKYECDSDLIKLMMLKKYLDKVGFPSNLSDTELLIYYMPYSRMDRSEDDSAFTLKYVAEFINNLKFDKVTVVEPHSDVTLALLDNVEPKYINFDLLPKVMKKVNFDAEKDYIMFPDLGASQRYKNMNTNNVVIGHKVRDFKTGEILRLDLIGDNKHFLNKAIIVDDLSSYGGTFIHSAKKLLEVGFDEIYLLVAHAENSIFKGQLFSHVDKVFTTDSILTEQNHWSNKKHESQLEIFELEKILNS